jgi:hypothetical protein
VVRELFVFVIAFFLAIGAAVAIGCALSVYGLRRANRVSPGRKSHAPVTWLWSWRQPARLHRRLRRAVQSCSLPVVTGTPTLRPLSEEVANRAAMVDDELATTRHIHWALRLPLMTRLSAAVREIERSALHLNRLGTEWRRGIHQVALSESQAGLDLPSRMNAAEAALAEVTAANRQYSSAP